ncbi:unnamed protein product [Adineta ricciae]|uniref:Uncharacterized protein n=1 Tax=Adineta ricciae TaxID=249248 RepID=A0A815S5R0_ADIRI|nr:unnamed protein product [Adineta ricciae]
MKGISNVINTLLQPLVTKFFRNKQIAVASDAIDKWREYADMTTMPSCSYFVTIHLRHLRSSLPFHLIIASLEHFFHYFGSMTHINGISTATILQLTRLLLDNQYCIYENKLYRQTIIKLGEEKGKVYDIDEQLKTSEQSPKYYSASSLESV